LDSTYISPDAAGNAFCEVLDSNLDLENGYVAPGFVGFSSVIAGKLWEVAIIQLWRLPFVSFRIDFQLSPQSLVISQLHEMSCLLSLPVRSPALSLHWHPEIPDLC
jgi:hypothetical protein